MIGLGFGRTNDELGLPKNGAENGGNDLQMIRIPASRMVFPNEILQLRKVEKLMKMPR